MRNSETMRALRKSTIALESSAFFVGTIPFALQPASLRFQETYFHRDEDSLCREDIYLRLIDALLCDRHMGFCGANTYVRCRERLFRREDNPASSRRFIASYKSNIVSSQSYIVLSSG